MALNLDVLLCSAGCAPSDISHSKPAVGSCGAHPQHPRRTRSRVRDPSLQCEAYSSSFGMARPWRPLAGLLD